MSDMSHASLLGDIFEVLYVDIHASPEPVSSAVQPVYFSCRPYSAFTYEKTTALGRFKGDIGLPDLSEFSFALHELLTEKVQKIILDFSAVTLSKTAIGVFITFAAAIFGLNKRLYIYKASEHVKLTLEELGIKKFFAFIETEDDIIATIAL